MKQNKYFCIILVLLMALVLTGSGCLSEGTEGAKEKGPLNISNESVLSNIAPNPVTPWNPISTEPKIGHKAYIHPKATVIGDVTIGECVMVSPYASVRGDEGMPIYIGDKSNIQDGVVVHGLETVNEEGKTIEKNLVEVNGTRYSVYVGERVSLAHQAQVHGPAYVGNDTFVGMKAMVFKAKVGNNCVLEPMSGAIGVTVPDGRYIPSGVVVTSQAEADKLPEIGEDYAFKQTNEAVVYVNVNLAEGYSKM